MGETLEHAGYSLHMQDGFRPLGVQEGLFKRRYQMAKDSYPDWTEEDLLLEAKSKTAFTPRFASHKGGAAVDLMLKDLSTNALLDIGHEYPEGGAIVALESPFVTQNQWTARQLLRLLARDAGFVMYPFEDWHICKSDTTAAAVEQEGERIAAYGPVKRFDNRTGEIIEAYDARELDETFSVE